MRKESMIEPSLDAAVPAEQSAPWPAKSIRWLVWIAFVIIWTRGLLLPSPQNYVSYEPVLEYSFEISKALHVSAYALFAILSGWLQVAPRRRWVLLLLMSAHAFATEFAQIYVKDRHPSFRDVGLDHIGIAIGLLISWNWWRPSSKAG
jgi:VanZ family protein